MESNTINMDFALFDDADFDLSELDLQDFECAIVTDSSSGTEHIKLHLYLVVFR